MSGGQTLPEKLVSPVVYQKTNQKTDEKLIKKRIKENGSENGSENEEFKLRCQLSEKESQG